LISLVCGFDPNSTVPEVRRGPAVTSRRCTNFRQPAVLIVLLTARRSGVLQCSNRKGCDQWPLLLGLIAALRSHLPSGSEAFGVLLALADETR
jgi:hypothetical protein